MIHIFYDLKQWFKCQQIYIIYSFNLFFRLTINYKTNYYKNTIEFENNYHNIGLKVMEIKF